MVMAETGTVTSKSMINIPSKIRKKYGLKEGSRVAFVESEGGITLVPLLSMRELFGIDSAHRSELLQAIRELERERRREAAQ